MFFKRGSPAREGFPCFGKHFLSSGFIPNGKFVKIDFPESDWEPLKTPVKSKNGQGAPDTRKAGEGGLAPVETD